MFTSVVITNCIVLLSHCAEIRQVGATIKHLVFIPNLFLFAPYLTTLSVDQITIILPVLYGCQTRSLTLREEHRPRLYESSVLKKIFGPKRGEVAGSREDYITRSSRFVHLTKYYSVKPINIKVKDENWSKYVGKGRCRYY